MLVLCGRRELRLQLLSSGSPIAYAAGWAMLDSAPPVSAETARYQMEMAVAREHCGSLVTGPSVTLVLSNSLEQPFIPPERVDGMPQVTRFVIGDLVAHHLKPLRSDGPVREQEAIPKASLDHARWPKPL